MEKIYNFIANKRSDITGCLVLLFTVIYIIVGIPGSDLQPQAMIVRIITVAISGGMIALNILNAILITTVKKEDWGNLGKFPPDDLKAYVWLGITLGVAMPAISIISAFEIAKIF
ncbi:hypothetical protein SAMN05216302_10722 [Nitrosomonas aestuarii]|uniref:Uncharacterized protein n=1 Tax=Nitrosomonas aestuarii TaxID=52441 RepID=A0A1I4H7W1_9PROT|nr:hypothetical protein [Nitrosomonas aestuarii]SFL37707.1 hypothetical protein SAMN05216302_10722 [Nitrosomonas aestuarii]